jgi:hypothetical protein
MIGKSLTIKQYDRSYQPKSKVRKGNTYTQARLRLEEVIQALTETVEEEAEENKAVKAKELVSDARTPDPVMDVPKVLAHTVTVQPLNLSPRSNHCK